MPKMTVIIPAYNSEKFISQTLDSLLSQTLDDLEIVVVNDGSTDSTKQIVEKYSKEHPFIKQFEQENAGVSAARNFGLENATGEYVVFLDADDYYSPSSLEAFYNQGQKSGADIIIGRLCPFNEERIGKFNVYADKLAQTEKIETFDKTLLWNFLVSNKCYKRERLVESGVRFPPFRYSEEGAFFMRYVYTGAKISGTFGSEMYYRRHSKKEGLSVSQTVSAELAKSFSASLEMIFQDAKAALSKFVGEIDSEDYLQEIIYKDAYVLISQFYRAMWHGDDECVAYCAKEYKRLSSLMTEQRRTACEQVERDLDLQNICASKDEVAKKPNISAVIKETKKDLLPVLSMIYDQTSPMFEVIVSKKAVQNGNVPEEYLQMQNFVVANGNLKSAAKGRVVSFGAKSVLDLRVFRLIYKLPIPKKLLLLFCSPILKMLNFMLVKRILK